MRCSLISAAMALMLVTPALGGHEHPPPSYKRPDGGKGSVTRGASSPLLFRSMGAYGVRRRRFVFPRTP